MHIDYFCRNIICIYCYFFFPIPYQLSRREIPKIIEVHRRDLVRPTVYLALALDHFTNIKPLISTQIHARCRQRYFALSRDYVNVSSTRILSP